MSSSEEYLDNLLKALLESENTSGAGTEKSEPDSPEELFASIGGMAEKVDTGAADTALEKQQSQSVDVASNKAMSTDEIEEMLASMTETAPEETSQDSEGVTLVEQIANELMPDSPVVVMEDGQKDSDSSGWALEEDVLPEERESRADLEETASDWGLEEELILEEDALETEADSSGWALEEDVLPEEREPRADLEETTSDWGLEEESLLEEDALETEADSSGWALEEDVLPEERESRADLEETTSDWGLEEEPLLEEDALETEADSSSWALEEDLLPEEREPRADLEETTSDWGLEEESLLEEDALETEADSSSWALEEDLLPEEIIPKEDAFLNDWALEEDSLSEETGQEDVFTADWALEEVPTQRRTMEDPFMADWALEEDLLPEEIIPEETEVLEDEALQEDLELDALNLQESEITSLDDLSMEELEIPGLEELSAEEPELPNIEELSLEEPELLNIEELSLEEPGLPNIEELSLEEPGLPNIEELGLEEPAMPILEELSFEEAEGLDLEESPVPALEELGPKEPRKKEPPLSIPDEWDLDMEDLLDLKELEQMAPEDETAEDSLLLEKLLSDRESVENEIMQEEETTLNEWTLDEETMPEDVASDIEQEATMMDATMSEEDVDRLLGDDFALEESGEEDEGLSALLASMGQDEDLSEINDLLEKADKGLMEDDDMLALLESTPDEGSEEGDDAFDFWGKEEEIPIRERSTRESVSEEPEEEIPNKKEKKKKRGKAGSKKTKKGGQGEMELADQLLARLGDEEAGPKKQGPFGKFMSMLFEDEDDFPNKNMDVNDADRELGNLSDENREVLAELKEEDGKKKKNKKEKKKKEPKKKADDKKDKKPKKAKKPKKVKKPKVEEPRVPEKKISRTKIIFVVLFCTSVAACIIVVNRFIPDYMQRQEACELYEKKQYEKAYELLYGKELNEEETMVLQKSTIILQVQQKLDFYETYSRLNMQMEALDTLIEGVERYHAFINDAQQYGVAGEIEDIYAQILAELSGTYGISEEDALLILSSEDDLTYNERLYGIMNGTGIETEEEEQPKIKQDILPEEEEIIDRLEGEAIPEEETVSPEDEDMAEVSEELPEQDL